MYKEDLALNNLQVLICHKTQPNQTKSYIFNIYEEDLALNNLKWLICHKIQPNQCISKLLTHPNVSKLQK